MTESQIPSNLRFSTLGERRRTDCLLYHEIYLWKMQHAPENVHRFCDPALPLKEREALALWIRSLDDRTSCQSLQILFSFSVPNLPALDAIAALGEPLVSAGAGTGYWEYLLQQRGLDVVAFDQNTVFPPQMRYTEIQTDGPEFLTNIKGRALMLSWPDQGEDSTFALECLNCYQGRTIIHVGELFGETLSANPWGQSTSRAFQLRLAEHFRCVRRVELPNWPGHVDTLTIWTRAAPTQHCVGADMKFVHLPTPRYLGLDRAASS